MQGVYIHKNGLLISCFPFSPSPAAGCPVLKPMEHGFMAVSYSGAVVRFWCEDGTFIKGADLLICDGQNWNDSQPDCIGGPLSWFHPHIYTIIIITVCVKSTCKISYWLPILFVGRI